MKTINPSRRREHGTQIAEFAIALPLLVFLVLIVTEGANFIRAHAVLNNMAREGAHLAAMDENKPFTIDHTGGIVNDMQLYASNNGLLFPGCAGKTTTAAVSDNSGGWKNGCLTEAAGDTTNPNSPCALATYCKSWTASDANAPGWNCSSINITISQVQTTPLLVPGSLVHITTSNVQVKCDWQLQILPRIGWLGGSGTVALAGAAEFQNFYGP